MPELSALWQWEDGSFDRATYRQTPAGWHVSGRHGDTRYVITLDRQHRCLTLQASCGDHTLSLNRTPIGWQDAEGSVIGGSRAVLDLDLSWSAVTNAFPIRRLMAEERDEGTFDVLMVHQPDFSLEVVRQRYRRDGAGWLYENLDSGFSAHLMVDKDGQVVDYPGLCNLREIEE